MASLNSRSRKIALKFIEGDQQENLSYVDLAQKLAERKDVVIDGLDLGDKRVAKAFVVAFAGRHGATHAQ